MTINEALEVLKQLEQRIGELRSLRNENAYRETFRSSGEVIKVNEPMYDVKKLDKTLQNLYKQMRLLKGAIKKTNAEAKVVGYEGIAAESIDLGEIE